MMLSVICFSAMQYAVMGSSIVKFVAKAIVVKLCQTKNVVTNNRNTCEGARKNLAAVLKTVGRTVWSLTLFADGECLIGLQ